MQDKTISGKPLPCEHCDSGDPVVSRCTHCSVFMCEFCVTVHKRINTFKGHQILSLAEVQKLGSKALVKPSFCAKHTGETLKLFCETCQETICRDCTIVDHREHKYNFVADVAERERNVVQSSLNKTKAKEGTVVEGLKGVQTMKQRVQNKMSEVNKEVDVFFNEQAKALESYRANLKHEVTTQCQVRVSQLEKQSEPIDPQKYTVSFVGGEDGVMYDSLVVQTVELLLTNKDEGAEPGGHRVNARVIFVTGDDKENRPQVETLPVLDNGDGSYTFSYCAKSTGHVKLSVMVEGQEVRGSPFTWEVYPVLVRSATIPGTMQCYRNPKIGINFNRQEQGKCMKENGGRRCR